MKKMWKRSKGILVPIEKENTWPTDYLPQLFICIATLFRPKLEEEDEYEHSLLHGHIQFTEYAHGNYQEFVESITYTIDGYIAYRTIGETGAVLGAQFNDRLSILLNDSNFQRTRYYPRNEISMFQGGM